MKATTNDSLSRSLWDLTAMALLTLGIPYIINRTETNLSVFL